MYEKKICYIDCSKLSLEELLLKCKGTDNNGWDKYLICNEEDGELTEEYLDKLRNLIRNVEAPFMVKGTIKRFEDVKKLLYTGASYCVMEYSSLHDKNVIIESLKRFQNKIIIEVKNSSNKSNVSWIQENKNIIKEWFSLGLYGILIESKHEDIQFIEQELSKELLHEGNFFILKKEDNRKESCNLIEIGKTTPFGITMEFSQFKLNKDGLIPVVVQDHKTNDVLMVAYMNEESFLKTIETGRMTYYSRSRESLWLKGETSGHIQILMSLEIDCDKDTLLAKVKQTGAACHTGNTTCFYTNLVQREYTHTNPLTVLSQVMDVIKDRKINPKDGSYTNYLFDKGIDKILKKCGEEATEIIIAAKNPNQEELKYEISDFLYHMMVLMVECNVEWEDILRELANR